MDVRLTSEQQQLRHAAARVADDLGPRSVHDLDDEERRARLEKAVDATGWRVLRSDDASGVEVALVVEEFARRLVDVPFIGPVLDDDLRRNFTSSLRPSTIAVGDQVADARGMDRALLVQRDQVLACQVGPVATGTDLTRGIAELIGPLDPLGNLPRHVIDRWRALAVVATCADMLGAARGAHRLACEYAKVREQYRRPVGSFQAVAHLLAEGLALIEGSVSVLRHAAWAVDEAPPAEAIRAAQIAKVYTTQAARTVCETAVQVHGGIGNTWECLAHVYLRRVLASTDLFPVSLEEIDLGLS